MNTDWVANEFSQANFGDVRLSRRLMNIAKLFSKKRCSGLARCSDKPKEVKGCIRFFVNEKVDMQSIHQAHVRETIKRAKVENTVLNIQDTSGLNYDKHQKAKSDIGHIGTSSKKIDSLGYWLHTGLVCDTAGVPLGISYQKIWTRTEVKSREGNNQRKSRLRATPIEDKESNRWLEGVRECQSFRDAGVNVVHVCDREADIFEFMDSCLDVCDNFLIRAKSNRIVTLKNTTNTLFEVISSQKIGATTEVKITGNSERQEKNINVGIRWCNVEIQVPKSNRMAKYRVNLEPISVNCIMVTSKSKINAKPIQWVLLTSLSIKNQNDAIRLVRWYSLRWQIEVFHKVLKSGLGIEECRLSNIKKMSTYILLQSIIGYRIMFLTYYSRNHPNDLAINIFPEDEFKILFKILFSGERYSSKISIKKVVVRIAQFGGFFQSRSRNPGVCAIWLGWYRVSERMDAIHAYFTE